MHWDLDRGEIRIKGLMSDIGIHFSLEEDEGDCDDGQSKVLLFLRAIFCLFSPWALMLDNHTIFLCTMLPLV